MMKEYQKVKEELDAVRKELKQKSELLNKTLDKDVLQTNTIFGRGTERFSDLLSKEKTEELIDEDEAPGEAENIVASLPTVISQKENHSKRGNSDPRVGKPTGKREDALSKLPQQDLFAINIPELDEKFGDGNWTIAFWKKHRMVKKQEALYYVENTYTPVISHGIGHEMETIPYEGQFLKHSIVSPSLLASIIYQKYRLGVPLYRQEQAMKDFGLSISRQTMSNWIMWASNELFWPVANYLNEYMKTIPYQQCDETTLQVIHDDRKAGSKSYVWVHITSELLKTHPIVCFCFELTRGTDHLRKFYQDFEGYITCDAYGAYHVLGKENEDRILICGCMMHLRRRFAKAFFLLNTQNLTPEVMDTLPEVKALKMIGDIYRADESLKHLSAEARQKRRQSEVRPLVESFYDYVESVDLSNPSLSDYCKDGFQYALNQKSYLCRFLEDGNIPIDDGATERHIRPFAIGRNNFLFCNTIAGAEAMATVYTLVETAKANGANAYWYLRYLMDEMPKHLDGTDRSFLPEMLPWSEPFLRYQEEHRHLGNPDLEIPNLYTEKPVHQRHSRKKNADPKVCYA